MTNDFTQLWDEKFDKEFPKKEGLFNTQSGWRIEADPNNIKNFVHSRDLALEAELKKEIVEKVEKMVDLLVAYYYQVDGILDESDLDEFHDKSVAKRVAEKYIKVVITLLNS